MCIKIKIIICESRILIVSFIVCNKKRLVLAKQRMICEAIIISRVSISRTIYFHFMKTRENSTGEYLPGIFLTSLELPPLRLKEIVRKIFICSVFPSHTFPRTSIGHNYYPSQNVIARAFFISIHILVAPHNAYYLLPYCFLMHYSAIKLERE